MNEFLVLNVNGTPSSFLLGKKMAECGRRGDDNLRRVTFLPAASAGTVA